MGARTGQQFLDGLRGDGRSIWLGAERVEDATEHPAFAGAARSLAALFDLQHERADVCLEKDPETSELVPLSHMIPRSADDLQRRRRCLETFAEATVGLVGRSPDYLNVTFAGFAGSAGQWAQFGNEEGAENLVRYQRKIAREDLSLTHTIVQTTIDMARDGDFPKVGADVPLQKIGETEHGIVVRGSKVLATLAPFSDELAVYPGPPAPEDSDDNFCLAFAIPMNTPGLTFLCRDSAAASAPHAATSSATAAASAHRAATSSATAAASAATRFDRPLSSRFDEQDAFVIFDDVEIPRERVFIFGNRAVHNSVLFPTWTANVLQQTMIRAQTKLEFVWGLAARMAETVNDRKPQTIQMLGEIRTYAELVYSALRLAEATAHDYGEGAWFPDDRPFAPLRSLVPTWFPRVNEILQLIGRHNLLTAPSRGQLDDPDLRPLIDRYLHGAGEVDAESRAALFRLAWDFVGSGLGGRNELYERFYFASASRWATAMHVLGDRTRADRLVDGMLQND